MKVLFDTNIVLDLLLDREPFADYAALLFSRVEHGEISGYLCATTITTIHYLLTKALGRKKAMDSIRTLTSLFELAPVNRLVIDQAIEAGFSDFEDAVLYQAAVHAGVGYVVTRNVADFQPEEIPVYSPEEFIGVIQTKES